MMFFLQSFCPEFLPKYFWRQVLESLHFLVFLLWTTGTYHLQLLFGILSFSHGWVLCFFKYVQNLSFRSFRSCLLFHCCGCFAARGGIRRKIVLVSNACPPEKSYQCSLLPGIWCSMFGVLSGEPGQLIALVNTDFFQTFFFNCVWRVVHIRFADRGLVVEGKPNVRLLGILYWITFATFLAIFYSGFPLQKMLAGKFGQTNAGRACLGQRWLNLNQITTMT